MNPNHKIYDVAIIGAGPAGATLARLLAEQYNVLVVDKRDLRKTAEQAKSCGGLLAPDAQRMLSRLELGLPQKVLSGPQLFVVRAIDTASKLERHYSRFYINMDRGAFERWLLSLVPSCTTVHLNSRFKGFIRKPGYCEIYLEKDGRRYTENAQMLVGADGSPSSVRKMVARNHPWPRHYVAIQEWVKSVKTLPHFTSVFDREITDYYCWTIPKQEELIVGAALAPGKGALGKFKVLRTKLHDCGIEYGRVIRREGASVYRPTRLRHMLPGHQNIAFIGEAGGFISPSSAEGFSYAFRSAVLLATALKPGLSDAVNRYRQNTKKLRYELWAKNLKARLIYTPRTRRLLMRSGLQALRINDS